jgi:aminoglycoside/choline kinase family phosphotransferase
MSPPPAPPELQIWAGEHLPSAAAAGEARLTPLTGDASNRRYFRLQTPVASYVVAEAPPATEKNAAFIAIREQLDRAGIRVPEIFAADLDKGYLLLEDLGDRLLLPTLTADNVDSHYGRALEILLRMAQAAPADPPVPVYDQALLSEELDRFPRWFVDGLLGYHVVPADRECLDKLWQLLLDNALEQPGVLVHRDFHSRNLMLQDDGQLAVIDFQDAVIGPVTYDLVSLLRDCYIRWPGRRVRQWALSHRDALRVAGHIASVSDAVFLRWFDWMGLQRHIKVLGTFARLYLRDGKVTYLRDLPLVVRYVRDVLAVYAPHEPAFAAFADWFDSALIPRIAAQSWSAVR